MLPGQDGSLGWSSCRRMEAIRRARPHWLGILLTLCLATFPCTAACPRLCACYVPTEVHCTFRYFTAVPPRIPPDVERINLGYVQPWDVTSCLSTLCKARIKSF